MPSFKNATIVFAFTATVFSPTVLSLPTTSPSSSLVAGQTALYNSYRGKAAPFPGNIQGATLPTKHGRPEPDDLLWQNLLAAEWIVFSFYQQAVEKFDTASFTSLGLPNTTYERITEIRDNEAGHLNAFYTVSRASRSLSIESNANMATGNQQCIHQARTVQLSLRLHGRRQLARSTGLDRGIVDGVSHGTRQTSKASLDSIILDRRGRSGVTPQYLGLNRSLER